MSTVLRLFFRRRKWMAEGSLFDRVLFFSDGVFAIAITLMIIEVLSSYDVPEAQVVRWHDIIDRWDHYIAYALSFGIIGLYWYAHHRIFAALRYYDRWLLLINVTFLGLVAFLPFPISIWSSAVTQPVPLSYYSFSLACTGLFLAAVWEYASASGLIDSDRLAPDAENRNPRGYFRTRLLITPVLYLIGGTLPLFWPSTATLIVVGLALSWLANATTLFDSVANVLSGNAPTVSLGRRGKTLPVSEEAPSISEATTDEAAAVRGDKQSQDPF